MQPKIDVGISIRLTDVTASNDSMAGHEQPRQSYHTITEASLLDELSHFTWTGNCVLIDSERKEKTFPTVTL
jgi:hypothetical protein